MYYILYDEERELIKKMLKWIVGVKKVDGKYVDIFKEDTPKEILEIPEKLKQFKH